MGNVFRIFGRDLKAIVTHFFALVIAIAMMILPALYAWVNIFANWDPYGNTGNVEILLANSDRGYTLESGEYVNKGQEIIEEIAQSTAIAWTIVDSEEEAIERVRSGQNYGALVMGENLSRNMYDLTSALRDEEPVIVFYQNAKTNAIAAKITTTAATTAEHNIQVKYLAVLIETILSQLSDILEELDGQGGVDAFIDLLTDLRDSLYEYSAAVGNMKIMDNGLLERIENAGNAVSGIGVSDSVFGSLAEAERIVETIRADTLGRVTTVSDALVDFSSKLNALQGVPLTRELLAPVIAAAGNAESAMKALKDSLPVEGSLSGLKVTQNTLDALIYRMQTIEEELQLLYDANTGGLIDTVLGGLNESVGAMQGVINENLTPGVNLIFDGLLRDIKSLNAIISSVNATLADIKPILDASKAALSSTRGSVGQLKNFLDSAANGMDKLLEKVIELRDSENLADLIELLNGDPEEFAEFLASPVEVTTSTIYPVENYGSAMTPFYSTLAIWVGGVVLCAIIKTEAEGERLKRVTDRQLYWGRFLTFFFLGQIQAFIIAWGDIHLLGCQCLYPAQFYLCCAVTSFVFIALIYSLTLAFGDVGKAIVVVTMIVQIAGSSGSYPIEILPKIFSGIYLFFPFPYAINAMREAICGMYKLDMYKYLGELLIFGVGGILIGLYVRRPFIGVNKFIEEEMEETGVL